MGKVFIQAKDIQNENAIWIDARFDLADATKGASLFAEGHIKNAIHWDLEKDLSDMTLEKSGRHPMPSKEKLTHLFQNSGLKNDETIFVYDQGGAPFATRAYWLLKYAGFNDVKIVQDGYSALVEAGFEVTSYASTPAQTSPILNWQDHLYVDRFYVKEVTEGKHNKVLVDARSHPRYLGEMEPLDPIAGHIPTARNFDWEQLKDGNQMVLNEDITKVVSKDENVIVYCGSGVSATPLYAVLDELGYENIQLYTGSYSDWVAHYEIAKGEE